MQFWSSLYGKFFEGFDVTRRWQSSYPSKLSINDSIRLFPERASVFQGNTASYKVEILKKLAIFRAAASIDEQVWQRGLMRW